MGIIIRKSMEGFTVILFLLFSILRVTTTLDTITPTLTVRDGETLASTGGRFELGFFCQGNSKNRYLGIWYTFSTSTVVWVANREVPLTDRSGALTITDRGILVLVNGTNSIIWSSGTNTSRTAQNPAGQLLDSGNLVVKDSHNDNLENFLWQSFDHPCDTLLPGMKLGWNLVTGRDTFLSSWKSTEDPARGNFTIRIDLHGFPQMVIKNGQKIQFRIGSWDGNTFTGISSLPNPIYKRKFVFTEKEVYYAYEPLNSSRIPRIVLRPSGVREVYVWLEKRNDWGFALTVPGDQCDTYASCGSYASCNMNNNPVCSCLKGFVPKSPKDWNLLDQTEGCIRKTELACDNGDGFLEYTREKLPDTSTSWYNTTMSLNECEQQCRKNCSCVAYANSDIRGGGSGCLLWFDNLIDMKEFEHSGQELLYVKLAASELEKRRHSIKKKKAAIIVSSVTLVTGVLILGFFLYVRKKKLTNIGIRQKGNRMNYINEDGKEDLELPIFDLSTITNATDKFSTSNKLGEGGFGPVHKGTLIDGKEIAVKRLSINSRQGLKEFKNEVILIAKLQHRNLVKLLGCCVQGEEKMLIYEFMANKSLDFFIFDQARRELLDWSKRIHIIGGIARGLLYLHQDSRLTIIHRDLKASNVLLDKDMNPKISDFGLARTFELNQTSANTNRVVGTYGYMAPEYMTDGIISVKSDVFSFGVLVLEVVSGNKNRGFCHPDHHFNLLGHAWKLWIEERPLELIDKSLGESCALSEILRCIHVGLLCVQKKPEDRPNMSSVVFMLGSEGLLCQPKQPGFYTERNGVEADRSTSNCEPCSENKITLTSLDAR